MTMGTLRRGLVAVLLLFAGLQPQAVEPQEQARRIISLIPAVTEMLFAIGAGPQVVGVGSYDDFPAEVRTLPRVGALLDPDLERIIALKPDLVDVYVDRFRASPMLILFCDIVEPGTGELYARDPRSTAKSAEAYVKSTGIGDTVYVGPEA